MNDSREDNKISRGFWAERQFQDLMSAPLVSEFVFRSLRYFDNDGKGKRTEKEVIDHLLLLGRQCVLISQKMQDDPTKRTSERNEQWVLKNIRRSLKPIIGAIKNPVEGLIWSDHPRLGKVEFQRLPQAIHGIVLAETWTPVDLSSIKNDLPFEVEGTPLTYLSVSDFVNLVLRLRTVPELIEYLQARQSLPKGSLLSIGNEMALFGLYLMQRGNLAGCKGLVDAEIQIDHDLDSFRAALERNNEWIRYSGFLEHVADRLATRDPN